MQGLAITDLTGRRILSTHFPSHLLSALAIDTASATTAPIAWVANLDAPVDPTTAESESTSSSDSEVEVDAAWGGQQGAAQGTAAAQARRKAAGGQAVCQIVRGKLRLIAPIVGDVGPVLPLQFLNEVYSVLEYYIGGPVTEASVKDHFDLILSLMDEMLSAGRPSLTAGPQLRELVPPLERGVAAKLAAEVAAAGLSGGTSNSGAKALLASAIPWRRPGLKHSSNEIYFDLAESLSLLLSPRGQTITSSVTGKIQCRSKLSGMPDLTMTFLDPAAMTDVAFHPSVRGARWRKEKVVSFVPPDGPFPLLTYSAPAPPAPAHPLLISSLLTCGTVGGSIQISLTARTTIHYLVVRVPLPQDASGFNVTVAGGAWVEQGKPSGAGRWEVEDGPDGEKDLVWTVAGLRTGDRAAVLQAQYLTSAGDPPPAYRVSFECPTSGFSGLRIAGVKVGAESYSIFKGVKVTGRAEVEVRT